MTGGALQPVEDDEDDLAFSDLLNRVLDRGLVVSGRVIISVADIDLVFLDLHLLVSAVETLVRREEERQS
jgi:gas vesicle structural protein